MNSPTSDEMLAQARRIAESGGFAGSESVRSLLIYLAEHSANHARDPVKEFTLATEALGRAADYDPRTYSTVRVVASRLRAKLAEYYMQDGARDRVLITIPKGSYSIVTTYRYENAPSNSESDGLVEPSPRYRIWGRLALVVALSLTVGFVPGYWFGRNGSRPQIGKGQFRFWSHFMKGDPPILVFSNPRWAGVPSIGMRLAGPSAPSDGPMNALYTGVGEVMAVRDITEQLNMMGRDGRVKRAQLFTWDDARSSDLIVIGGHEQNRAMAQLPRLEKFNLKADSEEPYLLRGAVRNEAPIPGKEQPYYFADTDLENGVEYAIVALTQGITPDRRVLILAGIHTFGTEAAVSFVCNPEMVDDLSRRLDVKGDDFPTFESLIEVQIRGGAPLLPKLLLVHRRKDGVPLH
jgi:hypothetical protein